MKLVNQILSASFAELNADQQKQAIEVMRNIEQTSGDNDFAESDIEYMKNEILPAYGIDDAEICWSGFWSQGDGASISTDNICIEKFLRKVRQWSKFKTLRNFIAGNEINAYVKRIDHHYSHENCVKGCVQFTWQAQYTPRQEAKADELQELITDTIRDLSRQLYKDLEKAYEYAVSDEALTDLIDANDYHFKVDSTGKVLSLA